ncbi:MAG: hypothetical protein ACK5JU_01535 [Bacteroidales bacterium]
MKMKNRTYLPNTLHRIIGLLMLAILPIYAIGSDMMGDYRYCSFHFELIEQSIPEINMFDDNASFVKQRSLRDGEKQSQPLPIFSFEKPFCSPKTDFIKVTSFIPFDSTNYLQLRSGSFLAFHCCFLI